jgi:CRP/FNR family transcriptional regulator, anaerobic regulatory protein
MFRSSLHEVATTNVAAVHQSPAADPQIDHADLVEACFARGTLRKVATEHTVWSEGDECRYVYLVRSGCLRLSQMLPDGRRAVHGFAFPGDVMGFDPIFHFVDVEAVEPTSLYALSMPQLHRAMEEDPAFSSAIKALAMRKLRVVQSHVTAVTRLAAGERLAHFLMELSKHSARQGGDPLRLNIPMRRIDVADYLGLTVETVCRTLTSFRNAGLITMDHAGEARVQDMRALDALARGASDPDDSMRRAS